MDKRIQSFIIACFFITALQAQPSLDSLKKILNNKGILDTTRINTLNETGIYLWKQGEDSLAMHYHQQAIALGKQKDFAKGEAIGRLQLVRMGFERMTDIKGMHAQLDTVFRLGQKHKENWILGMANFRRAQIYSLGFYEYADTLPVLYEKARLLFEKSGDAAMQGSVYAELASLEAGEGRFAAGIEYLLKARKLQESTGNKAALRATLPNLGSMYQSLRLYNKALETFAEAEKNATELGDERVLAFVAGKRGDIYKELKQYDSALIAYKKNAELFEKAGALNAVTNVYARMAETYLLKGNIAEAKRMNRYTDSLYFALIDVEESFFHYTNLNAARISLVEKKYDSAIFYAKRGVDTLQVSETILADELKTFYEILAQSFEAKGDYKNALINYQYFKAWSDSINSDEANQRALTADFNYQLERQQRDAEDALQNEKTNKLQLARNFLIGLVALIITVVLIVLWKNRQLKQKNLMLTQKNKEIEEALEKGQVLERKRIASELHDNLNTQLAAIKWYLDAIDVNVMLPRNKQIHQKLIEMTDSLYRDLRLISHLILPVAIEEDGLDGALKKMIEKVNHSSNVYFSFLHSGIGNLPKSIAHQLYNIALELTNNVVKHANATHATLRIMLNENGDLLMTMEDNGKGMPENGVTTGIGIKNIKARGLKLSGSIEWKPVQGGGTLVVVCVPSEQLVPDGEFDNAN